MAQEPDFFRDFGIIPHGVPAPTGIVRAYFPRGTMFSQYLGTLFFSGLAIALSGFLALYLPSPLNLLGSSCVLGLNGLWIYGVIRNDYAWIELEGDTLRARHLYTGRVVERSVDEIEDLLTNVLQIHDVTARIVEAWIGRVRGITIRFRDKRTPFPVSRTDPAMKNAKELIEAVIYRMWERGGVDAEFIDIEGRPLIQRVYWKSENQSSMAQ